MQRGLGLICFFVSLNFIPFSKRDVNSPSNKTLPRLRRFIISLPLDDV